MYPCNDSSTCMSMLLVVTCILMTLSVIYLQSQVHSCTRKLRVERFVNGATCTSSVTNVECHAAGGSTMNSHILQDTLPYDSIDDLTSFISVCDINLYEKNKSDSKSGCIIYVDKQKMQLEGKCYQLKVTQVTDDKISLVLTPKSFELLSYTGTVYLKNVGTGQVATVSPVETAMPDGSMRYCILDPSEEYFTKQAPPIFSYGYRQSHIHFTLQYAYPLPVTRTFAEDFQRNKMVQSNETPDMMYAIYNYRAYERGIVSTDAMGSTNLTKNPMISSIWNEMTQPAMTIWFNMTYMSTQFSTTEVELWSLAGDDEVVFAGPGSPASPGSTFSPPASSAGSPASSPDSPTAASSSCNTIIHAYVPTLTVQTSYNINTNMYYIVHIECKCGSSTMLLPLLMKYDIRTHVCLVLTNESIAAVTMDVGGAECAYGVRICGNNAFGSWKSLQWTVASQANIRVHNTSVACGRSVVTPMSVQ